MKIILQENIPLSSEDFETHIQKKSHKENEIGLQTKCKSVNGNDLLRIASNISTYNSNGLNGEQLMDVRMGPTFNTVIINESTEGSRSSSVDIPGSSIMATKLEDLIKVEQISQAISAKTIDITSRTAARINDEKQIVTLLTRYSKALDFTTKLMPFGSATYGFGGAGTNFNILFISGKNPALFCISKISKM